MYASKPLDTLKSHTKVALPPLTNPFVAIAEVDSPVIVVTTVAIAITTTDRPYGKDEKCLSYTELKSTNLQLISRIDLANLTWVYCICSNSSQKKALFPSCSFSWIQKKLDIIFNQQSKNHILEIQGNTYFLELTDMLQSGSKSNYFFSKAYTLYSLYTDFNN